MQKFFLICLVLCSITSTGIVSAADKLELSITPIRNDITASLSWWTRGSVTLYNNSNTANSFVMSAEDCATSNNNGTPLCNPPRTNIPIPTSLASWISFDTIGSFTIPARWSRVINYTINAPIDAIPGGHYWAIFFNNVSNSSGASISMNRRMWSLLLVTIPGDIIVQPDFGTITINNGGGWISWTWNSDKWGFFGKISNLGMIFSDSSIRDSILDFFNPLWSAPELDPNITFNTNIEIPVSNKGTIHINPEWKITLYEEDGTQLKNIWKELIINDNGAIIGEKIVDYITINEEQWNVLPWSNRTFKMDWSGFAREYITASGTIAINYETPGSYYSRISRENQGYIYPWEKLTISHTTKKLKAKIDLSYINPLTKTPVPQNSEIPLTIEYDEIIKTWNTGFIWIFGLTAYIIFVLRRRKRAKWDKKSKNIDAIINHEIEVLETAKAQIELSQPTKINDPIPTETVTPIASAPIVSAPIINQVAEPQISSKTIEMLVEFMSHAATQKQTPVKRTVKKKVAEPITEPVKKAPVRRATRVTTKETAPVKKTPIKRVTPAATPVKKTPVVKVNTAPVKKVSSEKASSKKDHEETGHKKKKHK